MNTSSGTLFESRATYICNNGYTLSGIPAQICGIDGNWTSTPPSCQCTSSMSVSETINTVSTESETTAPCKCSADNEATSIFENQDGMFKDETSSTSLIIGSSIGVLLLVSITVNILQAVCMTIYCQKWSLRAATKNSLSKKK